MMFISSLLGSNLFMFPPDHSCCLKKNIKKTKSYFVSVVQSIEGSAEADPLQYFSTTNRYIFRNWQTTISYGLSQNTYKYLKLIDSRFYRIPPTSFIHANSRTHFSETSKSHERPATQSLFLLKKCSYPSYRTLYAGSTIGLTGGSDPSSARRGETPWGRALWRSGDSPFHTLSRPVCTLPLPPGLSITPDELRIFFCKTLQSITDIISLSRL